MITPCSILRMRVDKRELASLGLSLRLIQPTYRPVVPEAVGVSRGLKEVGLGWGEDSYLWREAGLVGETTPNLELLVSGAWSHILLLLPRGFHLTLEDVARLTQLSLFGEVNAMGVILEGEDQIKLKISLL